MNATEDNAAVEDDAVRSTNWLRSAAEKEWGKAEGCTYLPDMTPHKEVVSSDRMWTVRNPTIRGDPYRAFNDIGVVPASKELQSSITDPTGFIHRFIFLFSTF